MPLELHSTFLFALDLQIWRAIPAGRPYRRILDLLQRWSWPFDFVIRQCLKFGSGEDAGMTQASAAQRRLCELGDCPIMIEAKVMNFEMKPRHCNACLCLPISHRSGSRRADLQFLRYDSIVLSKADEDRGNGNGFNSP